MVVTNSNSSKQSENDLVVVSIPYYHCKDGIYKAVKSILDQTHKNLLLVVVNDGDPDPPWEQLADIRDPRLIQFSLCQNEGRYFADAVVIDALNCPFYAMQDADDWSEPDRIARLIQKLKLSRAVGCVSWMNEFTYGNRKIEYSRTRKFEGINGPFTSKHEYRGNHHGVFKTDILRAVGGYYGGFRVAYDTLLINWLNMVGLVTQVEEPLYNRLVRPESLSHADDTGMKSEFRKRIHARLEWAYLETFQGYRKKQQGEIDDSQFFELIRKVRDSLVSSADQKRLKTETQRFRQHIKSIGLGDFIFSGNQTSITKTGRPKGCRPIMFANRRALRVWEDPTLTWTHWNISRWLANHLIKYLSEKEPKSILEIGSGISTLFLAAYAAQAGAKVICLEHDPVFYSHTNLLLKQFGLNQYVNLRLEPLVNYNTPAGRYKWYAVGFFGSFDFVFIDGPPKPQGRMGNLFAIASHLDANSEVWLHNANREHEQACEELWKRYFSFQKQHVPEDRGVLIMKKICSIKGRNETF